MGAGVNACCGACEAQWKRTWALDAGRKNAIEW